ncbi:MAG: hypothetical protein JXL97_04450, partial [Bacteroidales bacterium]|nr:hypothetical protein [Bacteroidales bacterium]
MKKANYLFIALITILSFSCQKLFNGEIFITEDITENTIWEAKNTYIIEGCISVQADLTIEPGTTIKFNPASKLTIGDVAYGSMVADGTEDEPIIFTSNAKIKSAGDWEYIEFAQYNSSSRSSMTYCTIEYGGLSESMLYITSTSIKMNYCTIQNSKNNGLHFYYEGKFSECKNNKIWNCGKHPVNTHINAIHTLDASNEILADNGFGIFINGHFYEIDGQYTWQNFDADYIVSESFSVALENSNSSLTLMPGCTLKFNADVFLYVGQYYYGKLTAVGTPEAPITFTSSSSSPSAGDWGSIV